MTEQEQREYERLKKLADELDRHPATIQQREKEAAETLVKRKAAADRIEALNIDMAACGVIAREIDEMVCQLKALDADREKLVNQIKGKRYFLAVEKAGIEGETRHETTILLNSYDKAIDEAITFFREKLDYLRSPGRVSFIAGGSERNIFTEKVTVRGQSNAEAVKEALLYCRNAIYILENMKTEPELDLLAIEKLKNEIPDINKFVDLEGERPIEKPPDAGFLQKVRQEMDARIARLLSIPLPR